MKLKCLRSEPEIFDTIEFLPGLNIITGERSGDGSKAGNKTNGVGKTLCINFIDFCLLSDYSRNRISKIPTEIIGESTDIILEFTLNNENFTIKRNVKHHKTPTIYVSGKSKDFENLNDARKYMFKHCFKDSVDASFRQILKVFNRVEKVGFIDIDKPDEAPKDPIPYLYLFGLNIDLYKTVLTKASALIDSHKYLREIKNDINRLGINIDEAGAYVNDIKDQLMAIDRAIENLSQDAVYDTISDDISQLDEQLENANLQLVSIKEEIRLINRVPEYQEIDHDDISAVYNDCKQSLGDLIVTEIDKIQEFKEIIDSFKNEVLSRRREKLIQQKTNLNQKIRNLSEEYKKKTSVLDKSGKLRSLKITLHEQQEKRQEYDRVYFLYDNHVKQESNKIALLAERSTALLEFKNDKEFNEEVLKNFEDTVLDIHNYLYGNKKASFGLEVKEAKRYDQKTFVKFEMQIDDSGSARTEHEKVLLFDFALLFCSETRKRHLDFLIHDGAFEGVNEDTKFQILNWLYQRQNDGDKFQYIATINRDSFEKLEANDDFEFALNDYVIAEYSKENRFLKQKYVEIRQT